MFGPPSLKRYAISAGVLLATAGAAAIGIPAFAASTAVTAAQPALLQNAASHASNPGPAATATRAGKRHRHPLVAALLEATVKETGLPATTVMQDLKAGQTINAIAGGKASAVENDVLNALQTRLAKAVTAGKITQQQATDRLARAKVRIEKLMSADLAKHAAPATAA